MSKKSILLLVFIIVLLFPLYSIFQVERALTARDELNDLEKVLRYYQVSIWISWVILVGTAVYYKWTEKSNFYFTGTYGFLIAAYVIFGIYTQRMVTLYNLPSRFEDNYTLGVFVAIQNLLVSAVLTGFLQAGAWWFTKRWHRR